MMEDNSLLECIIKRKWAHLLQSLIYCVVYSLSFNICDTMFSGWYLMIIQTRDCEVYDIEFQAFEEA